MIYILACDNIALFQSQIRGFGEFRAGGDAQKKKNTEMSRDSDSSGEGTGRGRRGKETDGGLFFMYIFCFFFKTWRGE